MSFPVPQEEIFGSQKRGRSARASPSPHHTLAQERTARFTARPFSALVQRVRTPAPHPEMTCGFLIKLVFTSGHQSVTPFLSGAPPKTYPGSAHAVGGRSEPILNFRNAPLRIHHTTTVMRIILRSMPRKRRRSLESNH